MQRSGHQLFDDMQADQPEQLWDIAQPPLFGAKSTGADALHAGDLLSFDALMHAPQARPLQVCMQREDAGARASNTQPLMAFVRSTLGITARTRCAARHRPS